VSSTAKTVGLVVLCVLALAAAIYSGYRSFVPAGRVTKGGSFGSKASERSEDSRGGDSLAGAPANNGPGAARGEGEGRGR
jgi:hypothetical protein